MMRPVCLVHLTMENFIVHKHTSFQLPARGVIAITGDNGSGKSLIVDAVAWALYGRTVRGASVVAERGSVTSVKATFSTGSGRVEVVRTRDHRASQGHVRVNPTSGEPYTLTFDTATQLNEWISQNFPAFDLWSRSCVYSTTRAQRFAEASDAVRREIVESAIALNDLDEAFVRATKAAKAAELARRDAAAKLDGASAVVEREQRAFAERAVLSSADVERLTKELNSTESATEGWRRELVARISEEGRASVALLGFQREESACTREHARAAEQLRALGDREQCPTCGSADTIEAARQTLENAVYSLRMSCEAAARACAAASNTHRLAKQNVDATQEKITRQEQREFELRTAIESAQVQPPTDHTALIAELTATYEKAERQAGLADAVAQVLSPRGARARLLDDALWLVQRRAQAVLSEIGAGFSIELRNVPPTATRANPALALVVLGAGGGEYDACSSGQRRKIDLALSIGLAELSSWSIDAAEAQTLFLDEVFDTLDARSRQYVSAWVNALARERAVLVVSHSAEFLADLNPARVARLHNGVVTWE